MVKKPTIKYMYTSINRTVYSNRDIDFIVEHYVGAVSSAKANALYFKKTYRGASANFFVDDYETWCVVPPKWAAWHVGGGSQGSGGKKFFGKCKNSNSVGIEMCCKRDKNGKLYISQKTLKRAGQLTRWLMQEYGIKATYVIRHYDVTGKNCPAPFINSAKWAEAKEILTGASTAKTVEYPTANLFKGDTGAQVRRLQRCLNKIMKADLDVDGSFGPKTFKALKKFQKKYGLKVDGKCGPKTRAKIKALV